MFSLGIRLLLLHPRLRERIGRSSRFFFGGGGRRRLCEGIQARIPQSSKCPQNLKLHEFRLLFFGRSPNSLSKKINVRLATEQGVTQNHRKYDRSWYFFYIAAKRVFLLCDTTAADCILKWGAKLLSKRNGVRTILGDVRRHQEALAIFVRYLQ